MTFTQTKSIDFMVELPLGGTRGQNVKIDHIEHMQDGNIS